MTPTNECQIGSVSVGVTHSLVLIAGPCVIESSDHCHFMAAELRAIAKRCGIPFIFKASFDKANRSSKDSFRGPGITEGLSILRSVRDVLEIPVLTDIHDVSQAELAAQVVDCLQIPAFLCRQTDLLVAAAQTGRAVNVKKGQFLSPWDMRNVVAKLRQSGCKQILLTERGTSFGYNNLVVDMRSFPIMRQFDCPVIFDVTHSLQLPGGKGTVSGGQSEFIAFLSRAGVAAGVDAVFMEVHDHPETALSDGPNALPLEELEPLLGQLIKIDQIVRH